MLFVVACTGPSISAEVMERVRHLPVVVVNGTFRLAPWAAALAANDRKWWLENPDALSFAGRKFSANPVEGVAAVDTNPTMRRPHCSGVLGLEVAALLGARRIVLLGADMHGTHWFGPYTGKLRNATAERRAAHAKQFRSWGAAHPEVEVINAAPGSRLRCFPMADLDSVLPGALN